MPGRITHALMRKQADTYRSQGLPQEALRVYENLLASAPSLPVNTQAAIRDQIQKIKIEIQCNLVDECASLTDDEIALIRQGWSEEATAEEIVASAKSFHEVGRYADALMEFNALIRKGVPIDRLGGPLASCLRHLHRPEELPSAVARLAAEFCPDAAAGVSLSVSIAETLQQRGHIDHALSLVLGLSQPDQSLPAELQRRLVALSRKLTRTSPEAPARSKRPSQDGFHYPPLPRAGGRLLRACRQFARRFMGRR